jgi:[ribosomal protein S18]-alanine N-acetyltransferase
MKTETIVISDALDHEREWAAHLMAGSEPWITIGRNLDETRDLLGAPDARLLIARRHSEPCGFILIRPRGVVYSPYIASLAVSEQDRGKGIGSQLLQFVEDLYRNESSHLFMCVSSFNTRAKALYDRLGYAVVGEFKDYAMTGASEYLLYKRLR